MKSADDQIRDFYNAHPYPLSSNYRNFFRRIVYEHVRDCNPVTILDAGCGTGNVTADIARLFPHAHVLGVDFAPRAVALAQKNYADLPNLEFKCADLRESLVPEGSIDLIYCQGVLHHIEQPSGALHLFRSYLRKQGTLVAWLYNPYGRRTIADIVTLERLLAGDGFDLKQRLAAVREADRWLTRASWVHWVEHHLTAVAREGLYPFLRLRLQARLQRMKQGQQRSDKSEMARLGFERKMADRYLNPSARYFTVDEAERLFRSTGFELANVLELSAMPLPHTVARSYLQPRLDDQDIRWRVLEVLTRPRGLTYLVQPLKDEANTIASCGSDHTRSS